MFIILLLQNKISSQDCDSNNFLIGEQITNNRWIKNNNGTKNW